MSLAAWPLTTHHEDLLRELARVLAIGGAWRFARGPVVAATARDYPEPWDQSRGALAKVIARTLWHAHLDVAATLEDGRAPTGRDRKHLRETRIELVRADDAGVELVTTSIGNDDVAGIVAHEIGRAYVACMSRGDHPWRSGDHGLPDAATGSLATIAIGLGVVAANAAHHDRSAGQTIGRTAYHEHQIAQAGGLPWHDLTFLLAVQATVRDDVLAALDTLRPSQAQDVAAWCEVLDDHEDELVQLLELGDMDTPPERPPVPREVTIRASFDEADLARVNLGRPVFRYYAGTQLPLYGILGAFGGSLLGGAAAAIFGPSLFMLIPIGAATVLGADHGRRKRMYRCATCRGFVTPEAAQCATCGGTIAGDIKHPDERLEAEEALEQAEV